ISVHTVDDRAVVIAPNDVMPTVGEVGAADIGKVGGNVAGDDAVGDGPGVAVVVDPATPLFVVRTLGCGVVGDRAVGEAQAAGIVLEDAATDGFARLEHLHAGRHNGAVAGDGAVGEVVRGVAAQRNSAAPGEAAFEA